MAEVNVSKNVSGRIIVSLRKTISNLQPSRKTKDIPSPLVGEGKGEGDFQDLIRKLLSKKYSYRTVKGYDSKTTEIYTHVSTKSLGKIKSPLDTLTLDEKRRW